jgi:hypothetical protein
MGGVREVTIFALGPLLPEPAGEVTLTLSQSATLWYFPLEAISNSEAGYERVYQGTCTLLWWDIALGPGESWEVTLQASLVDLPL